MKGGPIALKPIMSRILRLADALNRDDRQSLRLNIAIPVTLGLILNGLGLWLARNDPLDAAPWFAPPGWVSAIVWLCLLALLGAARWTLNSYTIIGVLMARTAVTLLLVACLVWPLYTLAAVNLSIQMIANGLTLLMAVAAILIVRQRSVEAASLIMPTIVWLAFTTLIAATALTQA